MATCRSRSTVVTAFLLLLVIALASGCAPAPAPSAPSKQASVEPSQPPPSQPPTPPVAKPKAPVIVSHGYGNVVAHEERHPTVRRYARRKVHEPTAGERATAEPPPPPPPPEPVPQSQDQQVMPPPTSSPPPVAVGAEQPPPPAAQRASNIVRVFYATDRARIAKSAPVSYGGDESADGRLSYGTAEVSIPKDHRMGELEEPILDVKILYDPRKYVTVLSTNETDEGRFFSSLKDEVAGSPRKQALIFVHGFNVSFGSALRRTAQLSYDLQFPGATICYTWPSRGSVFSYTADEDTVQWTAMHLRNFLQEVYEKSGATSIHLVAHSMGNRALLSALQQMGPAHTAEFDDVVLAAPDVASSYFIQLIPAVQSHAKHITLYASSKDQALKVSARVNHYRRAGDSQGAMTIIPPVETIDASTVDTGLLGHSYFGDSATVLSDLYYLVKDGLPAGQRSRLEKRTIPAGIYWAFRP